MNVLLVDDQREVLRYLQNIIPWDKLPVDQVFTACSAREARLIINNFTVDVILSDIEMPEEDGLSLCTWAKQAYPDLEVVFLTSHADFEYAKKAFEIGSFHYILQPVREEEIEDVLRRIHRKLTERQDYQRIKHRQIRVLGQKNTLLDAMLKSMEEGDTVKAEESYDCIKDILSMEFENCVLYPVLLQIVSWRRITEVWPDKQIRMTVCSILDDLLEEREGKAGIAGVSENLYWIFIALNKEEDDPDYLRRILQLFWDFAEQNTGFHSALYPCYDECTFAQAYVHLQQRMHANSDKQKGIFTDEPEDVSPAEPSEGAVGMAIDYVRRNIRKNISRTEVAEYVHLNEEYFSRLFKKETGVGFKEYVQAEKMEEARKYLAHSVLSVEVIASKLGYRNLSHFSTTFKKVTDLTPQEYRKQAKEK